MALDAFLSRRHFLIASTAASAGLALSFSDLQVRAAQIASGQSSHFFLTSDEAQVLAALCDRIIPADSSPSASEAGVVDYIDIQLASAWGKGARLYNQGPFADGTPEQGYQLRYVPADFYRAALKAINDNNPKAFAAKSDQEKDAYLTQLQKGQIRLGDIPGQTFFEVLRANTVEGYFADPAYGGNRDFAGWRMVGFPGADAYYLTEIDRYNLAYERAPSSITQDSSTTPVVFRPEDVPMDLTPRNGVKG
jgi:gluconate 2-dehydrogenase gamma chain